MNAAGLLILAIVVLVVLGGSRKYALLGVMAGILYLTQTQQFNIGGFNLYAFRFIELAAFIRVLARRELSFRRMEGLDKILLLFIIYTTLVYTLRASEGVAYRVGWAVDVFLCYFSFRSLISGVDEARAFLTALLVLTLPFAVLTLYESYTRHNLLAFVGGRIGGADLMRGGRLRACGSFRHPSLLGTFGATFLPIYIGLAFERSYRKFAILGVGACLSIVWASNSGGPLSCALVGLLGWALWRMRESMRLLRRGVVMLLVALGFAMKAPIWYIIARVSSVTGGDGYHRSRLMEQGFNHLNEWWLAGMPVERTQNWFAYYIHNTGGADITNQFLSYGIAAGLGSMGLFIYLLVMGFRSAGRAWRSYAEMSGNVHYFVWGLGVALAVHVFNWIGINYFDQTYAILYLQLALLVAMTAALNSDSNLNSEQPRAGSESWPPVKHLVTENT